MKLSFLVLLGLFAVGHCSNNFTETIRIPSVRASEDNSDLNDRLNLSKRTDPQVMGNDETLPEWNHDTNCSELFSNPQMPRAKLDEDLEMTLNQDQSEDETEDPREDENEDLREDETEDLRKDETEDQPKDKIEGPSEDEDEYQRRGEEMVRFLLDDD